MPGFQVNISTNPKYAHITLQTVTWVFTQLPCSAVQCLQCLRIIVIIKAGFEPGVRPITSPMSHFISNEPLHLQWATTSPMSHYISNEALHLQWAKTSPMSHYISIEPLHLQWATTSPMSHYISNEPLHLQWATISIMRHYISNEPLHLQWAETSSLSYLPIFFTTAYL